jgi:hypothetical protein
MAATTQGSGSFRNQEAALGGADAVPDTPQAPNPGARSQQLRKGESPGLTGPTTGKGPGITIVVLGVTFAIVVLVLLMMFGGFGMPLRGP